MGLASENPSLTPAQQTAFDEIISASKETHLVALFSPKGQGKSTVLRAVSTAAGGVYANVEDLLEASNGVSPLGIEDTFFRLVQQMMRDNDVVIFDDIDFLVRMAKEAYSQFLRATYLNSVAVAIADEARSKNKCVILGFGDSDLLSSIQRQPRSVKIPEFTSQDYTALFTIFLGDRVKNIDVEAIYRYAPKLNAHHIRLAAHMAAENGNVSSQRLFDYFRSSGLASNVEVDLVRDVELSDLKGVDDVVRALEVHVALPLERDDIAAELGLHPKRGVLLYGPPGTGKTTIGRALARRLRGKFFKIDGTLNADIRPDIFYESVRALFEEAKRNAPSVIFVDDADVLFSGEAHRGLYRYFLTLLDGIESESADRVCFMLTAMDVATLPPALIRSGRVELWLEMRLLDVAAREQLLVNAATGLPEWLKSVDWMHIAERTEGFAGADLLRVIEDAKMRFAFDQKRETVSANAFDYYDRALVELQANKEKQRQVVAV